MTMSTTTEHRAEYLLPGSFFPEETTKTVDSSDPIADAIAQAPANAYVFTVYEITVAPDLGPDFSVLPKPRNRSGRHYLGGRVHTVAELEAMGPDMRILVSNVSDVGAAIRCRTGNWQPFDRSSDVVHEMAGAS